MKLRREIVYIQRDGGDTGRSHHTDERCNDSWINRSFISRHIIPDR